MNRGFALMCVVALVLIAQSGAAIAQSRDKDNPSPLTSNEISGQIKVGRERKEYRDDYYYTFTAGPGEVVLRLGAQTSSDSVFAVAGISMDLYDENLNTIFCCALAQS